MQRIYELKCRPYDTSTNIINRKVCLLVCLFAIPSHQNGATDRPVGRPVGLAYLGPRHHSFRLEDQSPVQCPPKECPSRGKSKQTNKQEQLTDYRTMRRQ